MFRIFKFNLQEDEDFEKEPDLYIYTIATVAFDL